jgi:hypothetical protein
MIGARAMHRIFTVILVAALPVLAASPGFAHVYDGATDIVDTQARGPIAPGDGSHPASSFGRLAPDSIVECFSGCDASALR